MCFICEIYLPVSQTTEYFVLPNFAYVLPDGTHAPTLSGVAWCEHCGQFVPAEIIPSFQILDKWIDGASNPPYSFEVKFVANGNDDARKRIMYQT
jgi:hypothetical protein